MNGKRLAGATLLPIVAWVSTLSQDLLDARNHTQQPREKDKAATLPDLRLEPIAIRIAQGKLYGLLPLADGRILAFDRRDHQPVYLMTKTQPANGVYTLISQGSLTVQDGMVKEVSGTAHSSAHALSLDERGNVLVKWRVRLPNDAAGRAAQGPRGHRALSVIDLKDGRLMLLEGNRISRLKTRLAPDGKYQGLGVGSLSVRKGAVVPVAGDPDFELSDDFAP